MPSRIITEGIWHGDRLARCSKNAQLHFPRLYLFADDWGCFEIDRDQMIGKAYCKMPKKDQPSPDLLSCWLDEYAENFLLFRWSVGPHTYGFWPGEDSGRLPPISSRRKRHTPEPPEADVQLYLGKYYNPTDSCESTGIHVNPCVGLMSKEKGLMSKDGDGGLRFETVWKAYPRKKEKQAALRAFSARLKEGVSPDDLLRAAENYAAAVKKAGTEERYVKHGSTFFGPDKPYEDYVKTEDKQDTRESYRSDDIRACPVAEKRPPTPEEDAIAKKYIEQGKAAIGKAMP